MRRTLMLALCATTGCYNGISGPDAGEDDAPVAEDGEDGASEDGEDDDGAGVPSRDPDPVPDFATRSGLRRLTIAEYDNALADLLQDPTRPAGEFLPADALAPFDNDYAGQAPSEALIIAAEKLATEAAERLAADDDRLADLLPCVPSGPSDTECLDAFVAEFGRRAFRRPLTAQEREGFVALSAVGQEADDFRVGVAAVVRAMLQDPNFLYRIEVGEPVEGAPDIAKLTDWEMASRLSFLLWATIPDDALLDAAAAGELSTPAQLRAAAERMLDDVRAVDAIDRFHAMWLGYSRIGGGGLGTDMLLESRALIERVVFDDDAAWLSLLTADQAFVTPALADHYGLPMPAGQGAGWVDYGGGGRGGILSQGAVLSLGAKFEDTSPTVRGVELRNRLFCQDVEIPDDLEVNVDDPPGVNQDDCKWERYAAHREVAACAGCHALTDGLGFGLENYDATGAFRTHDPGKPQCEIAGDGEVAGVGDFNGPGELGTMLQGLPAVQRCAVQQLYRFATGRTEPDAADTAFLQKINRDLDGRTLHLRDLIVELAASEAFRFRTFAEEE